jgi:hypothetical protein
MGPLETRESLRSASASSSAACRGRHPLCIEHESREQPIECALAREAVPLAATTRFRLKDQTAFQQLADDLPGLWRVSSEQTAPVLEASRQRGPVAPAR